MEKNLEEGGLDPKVWLPKFKSIGATTPKGLKLCGEESFTALEKFAKTPLEIKILKKFLGMNSEPKNVKTPEDEMSQILKEAGLNPVYWLPKFKEIGISMPEALKQCGAESYESLINHAKTPFLKKTLQSFLGVNEEQSTFRQSQKKQLNEKYNKSKKDLDDLKKLQESGKKRHDESVKALERGIREALNVTTDTWIPPSADLDSLVNQLESYEAKLSGTLANRKDFDTSKMLIEQMSNGQMLRGTIHAKNIETRECVDLLLRAHNGLTVNGPSLDPETNKETFTSLKQEDSFIKNIHKVALSKTISAMGGLTTAAEASVSASLKIETEKSKKVQDERTYLSTVKNIIMPLACFSFSDNDLLLSQAALDTLQNIEKQLLQANVPECELQLAYEDFFSKFGNCANRGPYHLGGVYWLKSFSEGFKHDETEEIKTFHSEALSASLSVSYMFVGGGVEMSAGHAQGKFEGEHHKKLENRVKVTHGQRGGPSEVAGIQLWKDGLMASNNTWSIIGEEMNLVHIWEIIKMNHNKDFTNVENLAQRLSQAWEQMLHSLIQKSQLDLADDRQADDHQLLEKVKIWLSSKNKSDCLDNLNTLLDVKLHTSQTTDSSTEHWQQFYLSQTSIQCYLRWVVEVSTTEEQYTSRTTNTIQKIMQQVLEYTELVTVKYFLDRRFFLNWLYPAHKTTINTTDDSCKDLPSFLAFLQRVIKDYHHGRVLHNSISSSTNSEITAKMTVALNRLCFKHLNDKNYASLLLVTLLLPLDYSILDHHFRNDLTIKHLSYLETKLSEAINSHIQVLSQQDIGLQCQVYLFLQALQTDCPIDIEVTENMLNWHIKYLVSKIENLDDKICNALDESEQQSRYNFRQLQDLLKTINQKYQHQDVNLPDDDDFVFLEMPKPNNITKSKPNNGKYEIFLKDLNFLKYFPQKLTLQEALCINNNVRDDSNNTVDIGKILFVMLEKIKMSNHKCRKVTSNITGKIDIGNEFDDDDDDSYTEPDDDNDKDTDNSDDDDSDSNGYDDENGDNADSDEDNNDNENKETNCQFLIHPMDSLLALLHCCDNFLKQFLYQKLNIAQLAVPLLLMDPVTGDLEFPLWSMRSIVTYWKSKEKKVSHVVRIVDCELPLISFVRYSHPGTYSKSGILNKVMSESKHDFFFNHECEGSSAERKFADGTVEVCWYLPSGKESDTFNDAITFANFRGNAGSDEDSKQLAFLSFHSYMCFIFLAENDISMYRNSIQKLKSAKGKIIFLMDSCRKSKEEKLKKLVPKCSIMKLSLGKGKPKESVAIVREIQSKISTKFSKQTSMSPLCKLSACCVTEFSIKIDEQQFDSCQIGKQFANKIMIDIKDIDANEVKEKVIPLQGRKLWHKWARLDKQESRVKSEEMGLIGLEQFKSQKRSEKLKIRKDQLRQITKENRSPVMSTFIEVLLKQKPEVRSYFLQWLKFYLDDRSREILPDLQKQCKIASEKLQSKQITEEEKKALQQELQIHDEQLMYASFGIEHLFRELSQIYECVMELNSEGDKDLVTEVKTLCKVVAHLLQSGYPLEIMDGDAAHIPMQWITGILKSARSHMKLKCSKIAVLSVLGIQSTGKSTLLNTLFGIQFAVSAGRCTRGAYCQLLPVESSDYSSQAKCDYVLIIDTEGLRAPELDYQHTQQHDNELATLIIGLAGATLININGEVPADINDILQTSVHAFIRMRNVELKPSCHFVRHHVIDAAANQSDEGSQRFQHTLNEMTALAAKAENCVGQYKLFSDVIAFSNEKDIQNFSNLFEGNPPMAPVNPAYCEDALKLKSKFLELAESPDFLCSIDEFSMRIIKLWEAILEENFLFSFKNTLEVEAFARLDAEYGKWSWRLQNKVLEWECETRTSITPSSANVESIKAKQVLKIIEDLDKEYDTILIDFNNFFEQNPNTALASRMTQWRVQYENKLGNIKAEHMEKAPKFCQQLIEKQFAKTKLEEMKKTERGNINKCIKKLVSEMNIQNEDKKLTESDLEKIQEKFDQTWEQWMMELKQKHPLETELILDIEILYCIRNKCQLKQHDQVILSEVNRCPIESRGQPLQFLIDKDKHLDFGYIWKIAKDQMRDPISTNKKVDSAKQTNNEILKEARSLIDKCDTYDDKHIISIVRIITMKVLAFEKINEIQFTNDYIVNIILELAGYAYRVFLKLQHEALENHPVAYLHSLRSSYNTQFTALCNATAHEKASAICLNDLVRQKIQPTLMEKMSLRLADDVRNNNSIFASKKVLKGQVLLKLLKEKVFILYAEYLQNIPESYLFWIKQYVQDHCKTNRKGKWIIVDLANHELKFIVAKVITAAEKAREFSSDIKQWLTTFHSHLVGILPLDEQELHDIVQLQHNSDLKFFTDEFLKEIDRCQETYLASFKKPEESEELNMTHLIKEAAVIVRDNIAGCCEQCPFCKEQCEITDAKHDGDHFCLLHRPQCLGDYRCKDSEEMALDICTDNVGKDGSFKSSATNGEFVPYKKYRTIYPDWKIVDEGCTIVPYWKWFTAQYKDTIVEYFDFKPVKLNEDWTKLTPDDAKEDVKKRYQLDD